MIDSLINWDVYKMFLFLIGGDGAYLKLKVWRYQSPIQLKKTSLYSETVSISECTGIDINKLCYYQVIIRISSVDEFD